MQNTPTRNDDKKIDLEAAALEEQVAQIDRVARVVKGGRRFRFRALVVVGDRKNRVGVGSAKGADVTTAVTKATDVAKKHLITVSKYNDTLPHEAEAKVSGAQILVKPAAPGTGLIAGGVVRTVLEMAGISNALSKSFGSSNKTNIAYATLAALESIVPSSKWVTRSQPVKKTVKSDKEKTSQKSGKDKKQAGASSKATEEAKK